MYFTVIKETPAPLGMFGGAGAGGLFGLGNWVMAQQPQDNHYH